MIERPKLSLSEYGEIFEHTDDERNALSDYTRQYYKLINSLLVNNDGGYEVRNSMGRDFVPNSESDRNFYVKGVQEIIKTIPQVYTAMLKSELVNGRNNRMQVLHRGTSQGEINSLTIGNTVNRIISATELYEGANWESYMFNENKDAPVHMQIRINPNSRSTCYASFRNVRELFWLGKGNGCCSFY